MESNLDKIAQDLYGKIQTRFPNIKIGDENATVLSKKEDIPKARFFEFEYEENGEPLGTIAITLDADDGIVVQVSGDLVDDNQQTSGHSAYKFIRSFRQFAKDRLLNFDVQNIGKSNLDKRDYQFQARRKEQPVMTQPVMENKLYGGNKISYQDLGEARLVIKHNRAVDANLPAGRTMHIESIYIENAQGERFRYPFKHLNGARALAEHIKAGGNPYDGIGKHITGLSEELSSLRKFKGYVGRNESLSEAMSDITGKVMERIDAIKKEIHSLQRPAYYQSFAESFKEQEEKSIPEAIMNDWIDRLTIRTFNEELKSVFPYIYNLVDESELPVVELGADAFLGENDVEEDAGVESFAGKSNETYSPEDEFESYIENIVAEENDLFSPNADAQQAAIEKLNKIFEKELKGGPEGVNAVNSLKGIIDDAEFLNSLRDIDPDLDVRPLVQQYILANAPEIAAQINFGGEEGDAGEVETPPPAPEPAPAAAAEPMPAEQPAPVAEGKEEDLPFDPDPKPSKKVTPGKHGQGYSQARHLARQGLKKAVEKAKKAGATLETQLDFGHKVMTLKDAIEECGMTPADVGFKADESESGVEQILKSIAGFWNAKARNFTIGGTRAKTKVVKDFKDGAFPNASPEDVKKVIAMIEKMDPSSNEHNQIVRLAGLPSSSQAVDEQQDPREVDLNLLIKQLQAIQKNPEAFGQQMQQHIGQAIKPAMDQVPNQNVQVPGGQINPADMMKDIMSKINFGK